jgi:regulator of nonsense transcripts 2
MKNQQQAEREEQQRIKNLVLNYDLRENEEQDGDTNTNPLIPNTNIHKSIKAGPEKAPSHHINRPEKQGKERGGQRVRRLQMNDLDWYGSSHNNQDDPSASGVDPSPSAEGTDESKAAQRTDSKRASQPTLSKRPVSCAVSQTRYRNRINRSRQPQ